MTEYEKTDVPDHTKVQNKMTHLKKVSAPPITKGYFLVS